MWRVFVGILAWGLLHLTPAYSADLSRTFQQSLLNASEGIYVSPELATRAQKLSFIFVDGFDLGGGANFHTAIEVLKNNWHVYDVTILNPTNAYNISDAAEILSQKIRKIVSEKNKPVFLVGHSRGGAEAILMLLHHYDMLVNDDRPGIRYFAAVQSALHGSPIAGLWDSVCHSASIATQAFFFVPCRLTKTMSPTIESLVPAEMNRVMAEAKSQIHDGALISRNTFYLRSECPISRSSVLMKPTLLYIQSQFSQSPHESDGIIPTAWQKFDDFGSDLGVLEADHLSVTNDTNLGTSSLNFRQSAFEALLETTLSN